MFNPLAEYAEGGASARRSMMNLDTYMDSSTDGAASSGAFENEAAAAGYKIPSAFTKSLGVFALDHPLRRVCIKTALHDGFDNFILLMIFCNCFTMALETPGLVIAIEKSC